MIWLSLIPAVVLAVVAVAGFARAAARPAPAPQPTSSPIPAGDIGVAALACRPGWEPASILGASADADGRLIIRTIGPDGARTGLVVPAGIPAALASVSSLLAIDDTPLDARSIASAITASRAGTIIAIRQETP